MRILYFVSILRNYTQLKNVNKVFRRQVSKTVLGDKITPLTENTLLGRMLIYLNNNTNKYQEDTLQLNGSNNIINNLIHGKIEGLRKLNVDQIAGLFYTANTNILSHKKQNLRKVLDLLDVECCLRISSMTPQNILKILSAFMHVIPNRITDYKFYQYATDNIDKCLKDISKKELLQFIFYIGLQKKSIKAQAVLRKCLRTINKEFLNDLTIEDLCIICNSAYRTNTKITTHVLEKVKQTLNENLSLLKDPALLITLLKTIKHNHYEDEDLLSTLSCTIFFNNTIQYYTFTAICHILSLFADHLYYDEELLNLLSKKGVEQLQENKDAKPKSTYLTEQIRAKDITTFTWALSYLGYDNIDKEVLEKMIVPKIKERIKIGEYKNNPEELVDCLLYMWMLNYRAIDLVHLALSQENVGAITASNRPKNRLRLNLLLTSIKFEEPRLFKDLKVQPSGVQSFNRNLQIESRPLLQKVLMVMKSMASDLEMNQIEIISQIPYLNILGISGYKDKMFKAVNIEVLDEYTCVKNQDCHPSGFMQLKLRILEQLDVPLIIIQHNEVDSMSDLEFRDFLKDEIKLFC